MALIIMCVDEPLQLSEQAWDAYAEQRDGWFAAILGCPGCREIRGYISPHYGTSPGSAAHIEFSTIEAARGFLESDLYRRIISEARGRLHQFSVASMGGAAWVLGATPTGVYGRLMPGLRRRRCEERDHESSRVDRMTQLCPSVWITPLDSLRRR